MRAMGREKIFRRRTEILLREPPPEAPGDVSRQTWTVAPNLGADQRLELGQDSRLNGCLGPGREAPPP